MRKCQDRRKGLSRGREDSMGRSHQKVTRHFNLSIMPSLFNLQQNNSFTGITRLPWPGLSIINPGKLTRPRTSFTKDLSQGSWNLSITSGGWSMSSTSSGPGASCYAGKAVYGTQGLSGWTLLFSVMGGPVAEIGRVVSSEAIPGSRVGRASRKRRSLNVKDD